MYLTLGATVAEDGKTGYRITSLATGPKLVKGRYDTFPREAGAGYFVVHYDRTGRVTKAEFDASQPSIGSPAYRRWALALARSFRLEPETVAGIGVPGEGQVPLVVCMGDKCPTLPPSHSRDASLDGELVAKSILKVRELPAGS